MHQFSQRIQHIYIYIYIYIKSFNWFSMCKLKSLFYLFEGINDKPNAYLRCDRWFWNGSKSRASCLWDKNKCRQHQAGVKCNERRSFSSKICINVGLELCVSVILSLFIICAHLRYNNNRFWITIIKEIDSIIIFYTYFHLKYYILILNYIYFRFTVFHWLYVFFTNFNNVIKVMQYNVFFWSNINVTIT